MRTVVVFACVLLSTAPAARAQNPLVTPGERVRLETIHAGRLEGVAVSATDRSVLLNQDGDQLEIASAEIERVWIRGRATRNGAVIGGLVGAAAGVTYGLLITRPESSPCDADNCTRAGVTAASGALGLAAGAGIGALIGSLIPRWKLRFP
jgi:hypothetical protein